MNKKRPKNAAASGGNPSAVQPEIDSKYISFVLVQHLTRHLKGNLAFLLAMHPPTHRRRVRTVPRRRI